jgi:hypothetical protein
MQEQRSCILRRAEPAGRPPCARVLWLAVVAGACSSLGVGVAPFGYQGRSTAAYDGGVFPPNLQWLPRLRGGGDARPAAAGRAQRAREAGRGADFFQEMQREAEFAEFREPNPEDIVAVPQDEADARFAVAATPNGGCTYFAAENVPCPSSVEGLQETGSQPAGGAWGGLYEHRWEDQIDIHERRCVNIVCEARASESSCPPLCPTHFGSLQDDAVLRGKWQLFPSSAGRFYGAHLRYAAVVFVDQCLLVAGGTR